MEGGGQSVKEAEAGGRWMGGEDSGDVDTE